MLIKSRIIYNSSSVKILLNNENENKTIVWLLGELGEKKYYIPNEINIVKNSFFIKFITNKYFYFKYCVLFFILVRNSIYGLMRGFKSYLLVRGLGYKIALAGDCLTFKIGFSHSISYKIPSNIKINVLPKKLRALRIFGNDYQQVKEISSHLKSFRKASAYKYQGIFFHKEKKKLKDSKKKSR